MNLLKAGWIQSKTLAIGWLLLMCFLFVMPSTNLPKGGWWVDIQLDKIVHIGLFAGLIFLWASAFELHLPATKWIVLVLAVLYGTLVELVQKQWIPNRSFDVYDIIADAAGAVLGLFVWLRVYKKNKPL